MQSVYNSVLDIDLFVGLLLETKNGVYAGPVTTYIMEEQFYRYKYGDRFFYAFANSANPFTEGNFEFSCKCITIIKLILFIFCRPNQGN